MGILKIPIDDAYWSAEYDLLGFTETVCKIHGQYKGIYKIYYHILLWVADKLLWRKEKDG